MQVNAERYKEPNIGAYGLRNNRIGFWGPYINMVF